VVSFVLLKVIALITPLRAHEEDEAGGLDMAESGERAYITADERM
jgi:Amt family ammonium transporter